MDVGQGDLDEFLALENSPTFTNTYYRHKCIFQISTSDPSEVKDR
jgi:hypothetical protein